MMTDSGTRAGAIGGPLRHIPVLLPKVLETLKPETDKIYIDGTFGAGGYARAICSSADCHVIGIDRDPEAIKNGASLASEFPGRLTLLEGRFGQMKQLLENRNIRQVDGVVLDLGVSSMQLDKADRGFSFQKDGPLDMRMSGQGASAADIVARLKAEELADILFRLGEERRSRAIARAIVAAREKAPITRTSQLANIIVGVLGRRGDETKHPATRSFQALRLFVNDELGQLAQGLSAAEQLLKPAGRLVIVTFHSLEDRIVKRFLSLRSGKQTRPSRHLPETNTKELEPSFHLVNRRPAKAGKEEIRDNPRSRSAQLRAAERTSAPAHELDLDAIGLPRLTIGSVEQFVGM